MSDALEKAVQLWLNRCCIAGGRGCWTDKALCWSYHRAYESGDFNKVRPILTKWGFEQTDHPKFGPSWVGIKLKDEARHPEFYEEFGPPKPAPRAWGLRDPRWDKLKEYRGG